MRRSSLSDNNRSPGWNRLWLRLASSHVSCMSVSFGQHGATVLWSKVTWDCQTFTFSFPSPVTAHFSFSFSPLTTAFFLSFFLSVTPSLSLPDPAVSPLSSSVFPSSSSSPSLFHFRPPSLIFDSDLTLIRSAGSWMFSLQRSLWSSSVKVPSSVIRKLWCDVRVPQKTC